ncbi:DUF1684 domain-containing protein [Microbacterium caowuchunii]|uniref:DUF1684 domain-containing protein n=1 Tax=Microbacterium caowuchunii TaxID=2614638 RepID=A0A5N0THE7_9MICO|nr:DUF1684 domain-containing protein [Microbacterium caowuchunii]KAA9134535.1 DUF1684 domain-containing protein [Microbacterium caowuchunii]
MPSPADHHRWRAERFAAVAAPTGNLALIETRWTGEHPDLEAAQAEAGPGRTVTPIQRTTSPDGHIEYGLRVWDADSPAIRAFDRIATYPFDPAWVLTGRFEPVAADRTVPFEHIRDNGGTRDLVVPGDVIVEIQGTEYTVSAFDDGGVLLLVFGDETNGTETYGSGRFLFVERAEGTGFGEPGPVVLDFNRAFVPPCGFSAQYNCPLPPASNRFPLPIRAGEKNVVFVDDFDIHAH